MAEKNDTLIYLDELPDCKAVHNYVDIKGWRVKDVNNRTIGKVDNLLINKEAMRVVYLDVEVDGSLIKNEPGNTIVPVSNGAYEFSSKDGDNHLIIPIGMVRLDKVHEQVYTSKIDTKTLAKVSRFRKGMPIDPMYELNTLRLYITEYTIGESANTHNRANGYTGL